MRPLHDPPDLGEVGAGVVTIGTIGVDTSGVLTDAGGGVVSTEGVLEAVSMSPSIPEA